MLFVHFSLTSSGVSCNSALSTTNIYPQIVPLYLKTVIWSPAFLCLQLEFSLLPCKFIKLIS